MQLWSAYLVTVHAHYALLAVFTTNCNVFVLFKENFGLLTKACPECTVHAVGRPLRAIFLFVFSPAEDFCHPFFVVFGD